MGAVLEVPAEAFPWLVEVRSESSYLYAYGCAPFPVVRREAGVIAVTLGRELLAPLGVACSVLLAHPYLERHQQTRG